MENLTRLLQYYAGDERVGQLAQTLNSTRPQRIFLSGVTGALDTFVLSGLFQRGFKHHLVICVDKEAAAYTYNTLSNLLPGTTIHFLPDSFKRPLQFDMLNPQHVLQRTEVVNHIAREYTEHAVIVTYPEALIEKVVSPEALAKRKISITRGRTLDLDQLIAQLVELGFTHTDFVYEPGQISVRGGIIDIFTFGNEWPYRVELFDDEVESIRTFDPFTQLSRKEIHHLSVIPNVHSDRVMHERVNIEAVLPEQTVCWVYDWQHLLDRVQMSFEKAVAIELKDLDQDDEDLLRYLKSDAFLPTRDVIASLEPRHLLLQRQGGLPVTAQIDFGSTPQPSFNKNFDLLIRTLQSNKRQGLTTYLFTANAKQIERFYSIFEDLEAHVEFHPVAVSIHAGFVDRNGGVVCYTDHQIFERFHRYQLRRGFTREQALNLKMLRDLVPGDFVTHIDHGIGRYSGLEKIEVNGRTQESVRLIYKNNDILYISINSLHKISKYVGKEGTPPALSKLGGDAWANLKRKTKRKVQDIAKKLIKLYAERRQSKGFAFPPDGYLQNELEASFIYEDTPDQITTTQAVKEDMMKPYPMDRLICGDVGFGKTEIAVRAAFKAVVGGKQVAVLVPTTILALQHYQTFKERLESFGVEIDYVNRFKTQGQRNKIFGRLKEGKLDIVIGTHGLLNKNVGFKDLGLLIVDEEQKFGVGAKERLRTLKVNVDTLTLTATPIPRTLQFSLLGARDLSIIRTPPPNRQPIHTERRVFNDELVKEAIYYEVNRGGQVFFVHNRVKTLPDIVGMLQRLCPDVDFAMAHGKMESRDLEETLLGFIDRAYDVLVCTNIIETGLDIPNANTIIINNANQFGLSDLHQLRGRVGRSNKKAYCYLFAPPLSVLSPEARKRLRTVEEFSELGSGFNIAMRDLDIRGAGNLLGAEQSGFITDIGYETYQKILEEAVTELKETEFKDLFQEELEQQQIFVRDVQIETDVEMLIPDEYVSSIDERLRLYTELDKIDTEAGIQAFERHLRDRFGKIPDIVYELFEGLRLRWICREMGFDRVILKNDKLRCFFVENPQSPFYETPYFQQFLGFIAAQGQEMGLRLKQSRKNLLVVKEGVTSLNAAHALLEQLKATLIDTPEQVQSQPI
ncbi:MAG: transcription-repair coupling factor [Saprospiraceae bacterium]|nr:transcription-repair coupling factor [Saprospiraceae bacterium]